ncbi:MAG TPA: hypothetical protein ENI64_07195 [Gammaproteobacteria bacterium]|nr:hypothetical protein [Gammaproteobacteria bacterium]
MASDQVPVVVQANSLDAAAARRAKKLVKASLAAIRSDQDEAVLEASADDFNGVIALATRGYRKFTGRVNVTDLGMESAFSLYVPANPFGKYLNLRVGLVPSSSGLKIDHVELGSISLPGDSSLKIAEWIINLLLGDRQGSYLISSIRSVEFENDLIRVRVRPIPDLGRRLSRLRGRVKLVRDDLALLGDPQTIRLYYAKLCALTLEHQMQHRVSFSVYIDKAFQLAASRSRTAQQAKTENQAALLALVLHLGSNRFETIIGKIRTGEVLTCRDNPGNVKLAGRSDLRQHFIVSAALQLLSDSGLGNAVGEFKELLDSIHGGSGFSFVDLAADRAGIRFAEMALDQQGDSLRLQQRLQLVPLEGLYFPDLSGFYENITQTEFEALYGDIYSKAYLAVVADIDKRIAALPLYQQ